MASLQKLLEPCDRKWSLPAKSRSNEGRIALNIAVPRKVPRPRCVAGGRAELFGGGARPGMQQQLPLRRSTLTPELGGGEVGRVLLPGSDSGVSGCQRPGKGQARGVEPGHLPFHVSSTSLFGFETKPKSGERSLIKVQTLLITAGVQMNASMRLSLEWGTCLNSWPWEVVPSRLWSRAINVPPDSLPGRLSMSLSLLFMCNIWFALMRWQIGWKSRVITWLQTYGLLP